MSKEAKILIAIAAVVLIGGVLLAVYANPRPQEAGKPVDEKSLVRDTSHMTGKVGAKVTVVEFGDYQCPGCGAAYPIMKEVLKQYGSNENFNFVFRNFPLESIHPNARVGAEAAEAASAQGKFWEMHDMLYEKQSDWTTSDDPVSKFVTYASAIGADPDKLKQAVSQHLSTDVIDSDIKDGNSVQVQGTPTFFINGSLFAPNPNSIPTLEDFKKKIEEELAK